MSETAELALAILQAMNQYDLSFNGAPILAACDCANAYEIQDALTMLVNSGGLLLENEVYVLPQNKAKPKPDLRAVITSSLEPRSLYGKVLAQPPSRGPRCSKCSGFRTYGGAPYCRCPKSDLDEMLDLDEEGLSTEPGSPDEMLKIDNANASERTGGALGSVCCVCQNRDKVCPNCNGQWAKEW